MTQTEIIAKNIIKYRKLKGLTQNDVASYLGITRAGYANYEQGVRSLSFETALQLGELFGVSTTTLGYVEENEEQPASVHKAEIEITPREIILVKAYRNNPDMQTAVDRLLKIEQPITIKSFRAASSVDNHEPKIDISEYTRNIAAGTGNEGLDDNKINEVNDFARQIAELENKSE